MTKNISILYLVIGIVIEEWIDFIFHQNISEKDKFYKMVHCLVLQNRLMENNSFLKNINPNDSLFNAKDLVHKL